MFSVQLLFREEGNGYSLFSLLIMWSVSECLSQRLASKPLPSGSDLFPKRRSVEMLGPWISCNSATNARIHSGAVSEIASVEQTLDRGNVFVAEVLAHRSLTVSSDLPYLLTI